MPQPSSTMRRRRRPPASTSTRISEAPASREFSRSSLTTEAGRSTTSPAAILLATWSGRIRMRPMHLDYTQKNRLLTAGQRRLPVGPQDYILPHSRHAASPRGAEFEGAFGIHGSILHGIAAAHVVIVP